MNHIQRLMKTLKLLSFCLLTLFAVTTSFGQPFTSALTLNDCIRIARANGPLGVIAQKIFEARQFNYRAFVSSLYPQLSLQGDVPGYYRSINPIILPDGSTVFTPQSQATSSVSLSIQQKIPLTGGDLSISSGLNRIDLFESSSQYYRSNPLNISYRQPIFQINTLKWNLESQDLQYQMATREHAEAMEDCSIDITNKFFDLSLASMNLENAALNLANNDTLYKISKGRFNVGKIGENDLLQSELAFLNAQTQFENAKVTLQHSQQIMLSALSLPPAAKISLREPTRISLLRVDPREALLHAQTNRSDVLNFRLQRLSAERNVAQAKSDNSFSAVMTANLGFNQRAQGVKDAYQNLLDQRQFSLRFDVPIYKWGARSEAVAAALADQQKTETSVEQERIALEQEVAYQVARINLLRTQVEVAAKTDTVAQRRFDVAKDRYLIGKIDIPNLFLAQSEKDNARRARIQTLWDYWSTYFRLRRLTLYDFEIKQSLVASSAND